MSLRIILIAAGVVGLLFGLMFLLAPDMAIQSFQLGTSDVASHLFARSEGAALVSVAVMNFVASRDPGASRRPRRELAPAHLWHRRRFHRGVPQDRRLACRRGHPRDLHRRVWLVSDEVARGPARLEFPPDGDRRRQVLDGVGD